MDWPKFAELLIVGATGVGVLLAGFLLFILKGIGAKQNAQSSLSNRIWAWAKREVGGLRTDMQDGRSMQDTEMRDIRRWVRHRERCMYTEMLEITRLIGSSADDVAGSIRKTLGSENHE